eukprot:TRINITY_DN88_c0_g1_i1.p1 TRINITY_DN88_c0_g1~~TRINITY_DN88_c0_g1_i1.p1  ORF type:complete len:217 (-),score=18.94 TRINITY_DN88_c0_g1_i1:41-691(-)
MQRTLLLIAVVAAFIGVTVATLGVDISQPTSQGSFQCMRNAGYSFVVVRAYLSLGRPDSAAPGSVAAAWAAGMAHVDVYMFPCPTCGSSAASQMAQLVQFLNSNRVRYGMIWLDIEGPGYWRDQNFNINFIAQLIAAAKNYGVHLGIYTSESQWSPITGNWAAPAGEGIPLWYAHYDGSPSFGDFRPFAGWNKPAIKQFRGTTSMCSAGVDENWYP